MADSRFLEIICEMQGIDSPATVRQEELRKLIRAHFGDEADEGQFLETDEGVLYRVIFETEEGDQVVFSDPEGLLDGEG